MSKKRKDGLGYCHCPIRRIRARPLQATSKRDIWGECACAPTILMKLGPVWNLTFTLGS